MASEITYATARARFASLLNEVVAGREAVIIRRRGAEDVALISAAEPHGLTETAHLVRSPRNAWRLLTALAQARRRRLSPPLASQGR